jgi:uncharacterized membrane protein (UPF0182 family)
LPQKAPTNGICSCAIYLLLRYLYQQPFGITDPIFNRDIGFYVFSLPFYMFTRDGLFVLFIMSGLVTAGWYLKNGALQIEGYFSGRNPCYSLGLGFSSENI